MSEETILFTVGATAYSKDGKSIFAKNVQFETANCAANDPAVIKAFDDLKDAIETGP